MNSFQFIRSARLILAHRRTRRKTKNEENHTGGKSGYGAEVTTDTRIELSNVFLLLPFLRVLSAPLKGVLKRVLCGESWFF
jgi:hypothetical protein